MGEVIVERLEGCKFLFYWPEIEGQLLTIPHVWDKWWTLESIYESTKSGRFQCWAVGTGDRIACVVFTEVAVYPANTVLQTFLALGSELVTMLPNVVDTLENFGLQHGCTRSEVIGRGGWAKILRSSGYEDTLATVGKDLRKMRIQ